MPFFGVLGLATALPVPAVEGVSQDTEEPCVKVRPALELIEAIPRLEDCVLDQIVGHIGIMGQRYGKGSKPWDESNDLVRQVLS
jgi:hypothetical protein